jgi:hypothetical protein
VLPEETVLLEIYVAREDGLARVSSGSGRDSVARRDCSVRDISCKRRWFC